MGYTNSLRILNERARYIVAALLLAFSVFVPILASAATVTERSIALSSAVASATAVSYKVAFTAPTTGAGAFVVEFCDDSPLIGVACNAPTGMNAAAAASATSGVTAVTGSANKIVVTKTIAADENVSVDVTGITNPAKGTVYARIVTYDTAVNAGLYTSTDLGDGEIDRGAVAFAITDGIAVSGDVLESLAFCLSGAAIADNCAGSPTAPVLKLGEDNAGVVSLTGTVSTGDVFTQLSTNAVNGAVVSLKSGATDCGGLVRAGSANNTDGCGIKPSLIADPLDPDAFLDATTNKALFGVRASALAAGGNPVGTLVAANGYNDTSYLMNYVAGNATGVTSTYGDQILTTSGAPANNQNMQLTFGASASTNTPAGSYSANLSMIATGTF